MYTKFSYAEVDYEDQSEFITDEMIKSLRSSYWFIPPHNPGLDLCGYFRGSMEAAQKSFRQCTHVSANIHACGKTSCSCLSCPRLLKWEQVEDIDPYDKDITGEYFVQVPCLKCGAPMVIDYERSDLIGEGKYIYTHNYCHCSASVVVQRDNPVVSLTITYLV